MTDAAPIDPVSSWKRLLTGLTAFAEALEMDSDAYQDLRIASLERRIAALECAHPALAPAQEGY